MAVLSALAAAPIAAGRAAAVALTPPGDRWGPVGGTVQIPITATGGTGILTFEVSAVVQSGAPDPTTVTGGPSSFAIAPDPTDSSKAIVSAVLGSVSTRYDVTVTVSDSGTGTSADTTFIFRVSPWQTGDVFAGVQDGKYEVYSPDGTLKEVMTVNPPDAGAGYYGLTTGCAIDWRTGLLYTTDFEYQTFTVDPVIESFNALTKASVHEQPAPPFDSYRPDAGDYIDWSPESVVLSNSGTIYVGHADGYFNLDAQPADSAGVGIYDGNTLMCWLDATGTACLRDATGAVLSSGETYPVGYYFVDSTGAIMQDAGGYLYYGSKDTSGKPYVVSIPAGGDPYWNAFTPLAGAAAVQPFFEYGPGQPIFDWDDPDNPTDASDPIPARLQWGQDIHVRPASGSPSYIDAAYGRQGTDWLDLSSDGRTLFYTSEYGTIYRYDLQTGTQLPPFAQLGASVITYALRLLPPGDGSGGLLVAGNERIYRLNGEGRVVRTYDADGEDVWFALNIDPDGSTFWSGDMYTGRMYRFDVVTGGVITGPILTGGPETGARLTGLCVQLEYTAAQEVCGNGADDDGDGLTDENCTALRISEWCENGVDDDGDGLGDAADPDCLPDNRPPVAGSLAEQVPEDVELLRCSLVNTECGFSATGTNLFLDQAGDPDCDINGENCDADRLEIKVTSLPLNGTVTFTVGGEPVSVGPSNPGTYDFMYDAQPGQQGSLGGTNVEVRYLPDAGYCGAVDSLTYTVTDPHGAVSTGAWVIEVICVNDPPSFVPGPAVSVLEDSGLATLAAWATDFSPGPPDESSQTLTLSVTNDNPALFSIQPALSLATGDLTFTPAPDAFGDARVRVTLQDDGGTTPGDDTFVYEFTISVLPVNDVPGFVKGFDQELNEGAGAQTVNGWATGITAGPANESGQVLAFVLVPDNPGLFSVQPAVDPATGTLTFTPAPQAFGATTVTVSLSDNGGIENGGVDTSPAQTFRISLTFVNDPPVAVNWPHDSVPEDGELLRCSDVSTTCGFGTNLFLDGVGDPDCDTDAVNGNHCDADQLAIKVTGLPLNGTVTFTVDGAPVSVGPSNPGTYDFMYDAQPGQPGSPGGTNVEVLYVPAANYCNYSNGQPAGPPDTLTYSVTDLHGAPSYGSWTIRVDCSGDAPVAVDDSYETTEDAPLNVGAAGVLGNDIEPDAGDTKTVTAVNGQLLLVGQQIVLPSGASVTLRADGSLSYQPAAAYQALAAGAFAVDTITYTVSDSGGASDTATVTITVNGLNDAPVAVNDSYSTAEDTPLNVSAASDVLQANDSDVDTPLASLTAVLVAGPAHAQTFTLNSDGSFSYVPAADYNGTDTFTYRASDGTASSNVATVTITITPVNDPPVGVNDAYTTSMNQTLTVPAPGVLGNDPPDVDGDTRTAVLYGIPPSGLTLNANGSFTYDPAGVPGAVSFTYRVFDGTAYSDPVTVVITVLLNAAPDCSAVSPAPATIWPPNHKFVRVGVQGVTDPDGDPLTLTISSIFQDEPTNTDGDGNHTPDGRIVPTPGGGSRAEVRAERSGTKKVPGDGRVYHISFTADDLQGGTCTGTVKVCVPHDQGGRSTCIDGGPLYNSLEVSPPRGTHDEQHCDDERHDHRSGSRKSGDDDRRGGRRR